jgi:hypothetical protein
VAVAVAAGHGPSQPANQQQLLLLLLLLGLL